MSKGIKNDGDKIRTDLLHVSLAKQVRQVVEVLTFGSKKYGDNNWKELDKGFDRTIAAAYRHLGQRLEGQRNDPETGLPHIAHAICSLFFALFFDDSSRDSVKEKRPVNSEWGSVSYTFTDHKHYLDDITAPVKYGKHTKFEE